MFESNRLCYGHIISFSPPDDHDSFVFCDGFISNKTVLKNFKTASQNSKFLDCLFQIYPSFLNSGKKAALGLKEELKKQEISEQKKREKIQDTLEKVSHEYKFNQDTFEKLRDTPISFDTPVQLLHVTSNKFLACNFKEEANYEKENFKLELTEYPSEYTFLKFLPVYTYQKRNDGVIYLHDTVYLVWASQYLNKMPFIHISSDFAKFKGKPKNDKILELEISDKKQAKIDQVVEKKQLEKSPRNDTDQPIITEQSDNELNEDDNFEREIPGIIGKPSKMKVVDFKDQNEKPLEMKPQASSMKVKKSIAALAKQKIEKSVGFKSGKNVLALTSSQQSDLKDTLHAQDSFDLINPGPKKEINVSLDSKSLWKINLIRANITDKNILCYGDIVWMNYSEKNSTLIAKSIESAKFLSRYQVGFVNSVFSEQQLQNFQGDTNGMWMIESEDYRRGGTVEWGTPLRLKHLISGRYLSVSDDFGPEDHQPEFSSPNLFEMVETPKRQSLFEFTILPTTISKANPQYIKSVPKDAFMKLRHSPSKYWMKFNHERGIVQSQDTLKKGEDVNTNTGLTASAGDEIAFKIFKANENEIWETNFLISCKPFLIAMLNYLRTFTEQNVSFRFFF